MVFVILLSFAAFITNPSKDHFTAWLTDKIKEEVKSDSPSDFENKISDLLANYLGKNILDVSTTHYDYKIFSIYKVNVLDNSMTFIGVFNMFFKTE